MVVLVVVFVVCVVSLVDVCVVVMVELVVYSGYHLFVGIALRAEQVH